MLYLNSLSIQCKVGRIVAGYYLPRGKSELHRAGCWVTPSEGDLKESATEIYRKPEIRCQRSVCRDYTRIAVSILARLILTFDLRFVRVKRCGKSAPAVR